MSSAAKGSMSQILSERCLVSDRRTVIGDRQPPSTSVLDQNFVKVLAYDNEGYANRLVDLASYIWRFYGVRVHAPLWCSNIVGGHAHLGPFCAVNQRNY